MSPVEHPPAWRAGAAIFLTALLVRAAYLFETAGTPLASVRIGDEAAYDALARSLAAGDWRAGGVSWQAPLYPHFLAFVYALVGARPPVALALQAVIGALASPLLAAATARSFGRRAGLAAGLWLALYAPAIAYGARLEKTALAMGLAAACLERASAWRARPRRRTALTLGLLLGALATTQENLAVLAGVLVPWMSRARGVPIGRRARAGHAVLALLGFAVLPGAAALRNAAAAGAPVPGATNFGVNLYLGNHEGADGLYSPLVAGRGTWRHEREDATRLAEAAAGRQLSALEVSAYWRDRSLEWMSAHPGRAARLFARKQRLLVADREWMDSASYLVAREESVLLGVLGAVFRWGVLLPLAALGAVLSVTRHRASVPLATALLAAAASVLAFFVFGRFRAPLAVLAMPFAAFALVSLGARRRPPALAIASGVLAGACAFWPVDPDLEYPRADTFNNLGSALREQGRDAEAETAYRRAVGARSDYAAPHHNLGRLLAEHGRFEEAERAFSAASLPEWRGEQLVILAGARLERGEAAVARDLLGRVDTARTPPEVALEVGRLLRLAGDPEGAAKAYRALLARDPAFAPAHNNLGWLAQSQGRWGEAAASYERAMALDPAYRQALVNLAWLRAAAPEDSLRDGPSAIELARRALSGGGEGDPALLDLLAAARAEAGELEQAIELAERALDLAPSGGALAEGLRARLAAYRAGSAWRLGP